jgi:hypothetical protein
LSREHTQIGINPGINTKILSPTKELGTCGRYREQLENGCGECPIVVHRYQRTDDAALQYLMRTTRTVRRHDWTATRQRFD